MTPAGFPHSDTPGSKLVCSSPRLIAAYRVLHRLLVPRHPPCALSSLTGLLLPKVLSLCLPSVSYSVVNEQPRPRGSRADPGPQSRSRPGIRENSFMAPRGSAQALSFSGGDSGARTRSLRLAKPALSQLSYIPDRRPSEEGREWWAWVDSNHPPHAYQACALTN